MAYVWINAATPCGHHYPVLWKPAKTKSSFVLICHLGLPHMLISHFILPNFLSSLQYFAFPQDQQSLEYITALTKIADLHHGGFNIEKLMGQVRHLQMMSDM